MTCVCLTRALSICSLFVLSASQERWLQDVVCDDAARWSQLPWDYLSFQEVQSWTTLGWNRELWDAAHPIATTSARAYVSLALLVALIHIDPKLVGFRCGVA
eukprot:s679_g14.t1